MGKSLILVHNKSFVKWVSIYFSANPQTNFVDVEVEFDYVAELGDELTIQVLYEWNPIIQARPLLNISSKVWVKKTLIYFFWLRRATLSMMSNEWAVDGGKEL